MEIDKYEDLLEKAKDFNNLRNGGIWKIVEDLVEAVEDLIEEVSFLYAGKDSNGSCQPVAAIGGAELDALVKRLRELARDMKKDAPEEWYEHEDVTAAADAITALRAQTDWKAMAERLGEVLARVPSSINSAFSAGIEERDGGSVRRQAKLMEPVDKLRDDARAALSDLAKMKGE